MLLAVPHTDWDRKYSNNYIIIRVAVERKSNKVVNAKNALVKKKRRKLWRVGSTIEQTVYLYQHRLLLIIINTTNL